MTQKDRKVERKSANYRPVTFLERVERQRIGRRSHSGVIDGVDADLVAGERQ